MIQAQNPEELQNNTDTKLPDSSVTKVYGFSQPTNNPSGTTQDAEIVPEHHYTPEWQKTFFHWWHKIALVMLIVHGLIGLWESIYFMAVEYPELNQLLLAHQVDTSEVNNLISRAIITLLATLITAFLAFRLAKVKETTAHNIDLVISTILIFTTSYLQDLLLRSDLLNSILGILSQ